MAPLVAAAIPKLLELFVGEAKEVIDRVVPDKAAAQAAKDALDAKKTDNGFQLATQQILANIEEIKSGHILGKWRGGLGWIAVFSIGYQLIVHPLLVGTVLLFDETFPVDKLPKLEWQELGKILMGMLGLV